MSAHKSSATAILESSCVQGSFLLSSGCGGGGVDGNGGSNKITVSYAEVFPVAIAAASSSSDQSMRARTFV